MPRESRTPAEIFATETNRAICAAFSVEAIDVASALVDMIPADRLRKEFRTRLTSAAYRNGLVVGLTIEPDDDRFPDCPYDGIRSNYAAGDNDPRDAWRRGSLDGQRIRNVVLCNGRAVIPGLQWREYKALSPEMRGAYDALPQSTTADRED